MDLSLIDHNLPGFPYVLANGLFRHPAYLTHPEGYLGFRQDSRGGQFIIRKHLPLGMRAQIEKVLFRWGRAGLVVDAAARRFTVALAGDEFLYVVLLDGIEYISGLGAAESVGRQNTAVLELAADSPRGEYQVVIASLSGDWATGVGSLALV